MDVDFEYFVAADVSYSIADAIREGFENEDRAYPDLAPVEPLTPPTAQEEVELQREYDAFYGTSPLNSPSPSPSSSRPSSPDPAARERELDKSFGASPLSSAPASPIASSPPPPNAETHSKPAGSSAAAPPVPSSSSLPNVRICSKPPGAGPSSKARQRQKNSHTNRRRKRQTERSQVDKNALPHANGWKYIAQAEATRTAYDTSDIPSASSGFIALPDRGPRVCPATEELLKDPRFQYIRWRGRITRAIVDRDGRVIAVLAGHPNDADWGTVQRTAHTAILSAKTRTRFMKKAMRHRRGDYPAAAVGISFGGGQKAPGNLKHDKPNAAELNGLLKHSSIRRIAGFASSAFKSWAPNLHGHYAKNLDGLLKAHPSLRRNFPNSVWAAATFNFGPKVVTKKHRDYANLPYGWCAVTALGDFDPTQGGHLVLWDLGLIIEFPPGSTILLPSAAISHSNTPISRTESRSSFAQYSAGGLFRWAAHGFRKDSEFFKGKSAEEREVIALENAARCKMGLSLFSTLEELRAAVESSLSS